MLWQKLLSAPPYIPSGVVGTPTYFPMRNTSVDPTNSTWRGLVTYTFVANDGIYTDSPLTTMESMFQGSAFNDVDVELWDTSTVTRMFNTFRSSTFNQDIGDWDVSAVTNMTRTFQDAVNFNQDLSSWCVSNFNSEPLRFSQGAVSWVLPKPIWGTCPS